MSASREDRARVLTLFDQQSRTFGRLVALFLIPTLLFGVLIFVPFTRQVESSGRIEGDLDSALSQLALRYESLAAIAAVDSLASHLRVAPRLRIDQDMRTRLWLALAEDEAGGDQRRQLWASGARDVDVRDIPGLTDRFGEDGAGASECVWLDDRRWRECFPVAMGVPLCIGRGCVVYPDLRTYLPSGPSGPLDELLAGELVDSLTEVERAIREDILDVRRSIEESGTVWGDDDLRAVEPIERFRNRVAQRQSEVQSEIRKLERDTAVLRSEIDRAERLITSIEKSGSSLQTPVGPLPVGIWDLVFLYPAILGAAYLVCLASFHRMLSLRRAYRDLGRRGDLEHPPQDDSYLTLTTPLWFDPLRPAGPQVGHLLLGLAPVGFMVWSYVALRSGMSSLDATAESRFGWGGYSVFFWFSLAAVGIGLVRVITAIRLDRTDAISRCEPTPEPPADRG